MTISKIPDFIFCTPNINEPIFLCVVLFTYRKKFNLVPATAASAATARVAAPSATALTVVPLDTDLAVGVWNFSQMTFNLDHTLMFSNII